MTYIPSQMQLAKNATALDALQARANAVRLELHRLGQLEFARRYLTGPRKPAHLVNF
jgi:hypothetical protein